MLHLVAAQCRKSAGIDPSPDPVQKPLCDALQNASGVSTSVRCSGISASGFPIFSMIGRGPRLLSVVARHVHYVVKQKQRVVRMSRRQGGHRVAQSNGVAPGSLKAIRVWQASGPGHLSRQGNVKPGRNINSRCSNRCRNKISDFSRNHYYIVVQCRERIRLHTHSMVCNLFVP